MTQDRIHPKLKPEYQGRELKPFEFRLRTPEEQAEYLREREAAEAERTRGWPVCQCCTRKKPLGDFLRHSLLVCVDCVDRGQRYGRPWHHRPRVPSHPTHTWFLNAASAVLKELERECRNMHNRGRTPDALMPQASPPALTLSNLPRT